MIDPTDLGEITAALKVAAEKTLKDLLEGAKGDVEGYIHSLLGELRRLAWNSVAFGEGKVTENLRDLKAQAALLAVKHAIIARRETMEFVGKAVEILARFSARALLALM